jgi:GDP-4-dehydro-6-deoxy-D-mannose reductase
MGDLGAVRRVAAAGPFGAVVHLAGVSSGGDARRDTVAAWELNTVGTARLLQELVQADGSETRVLYVSTAEVYGVVDTQEPLRETQEARPCSPYAASKYGGEIAALEFHRRLGMPVVVARSFPHSGRGQDRRFVLPAFAHRLQTAKRVRAAAIEVGNLYPVRDILHVADVVEAYVRLVEKGTPGEIYNVATGRGRSLEHILTRMCELVDYRVVIEVDARLVRIADIPYLVGDAGKLRDHTGWMPTRGLDDVLTEVLDAQAN